MFILDFTMRKCIKKNKILRASEKCYERKSVKDYNIDILNSLFGKYVSKDQQCLIFSQTQNLRNEKWSTDLCLLNFEDSNYENILKSAQIFGIK